MKKCLLFQLPKPRFGAFGLRIGKDTADSGNYGKDESTFDFPQPYKLVITDSFICIV